MKVYVSYKFQGADENELVDLLKQVDSVLAAAGHQVYILYKKNRKNWTGDCLQLTNEQIIKEAFKGIEKCEVLLAVVDSAEKSEGMLLEIGYALACKKRIYLAINKKLDGEYLRFVRALAEKVLVFKDQNDLLKQIKTL